MNEAEYDLLVIGGGINGAGVARDAAGRGLSVLLVEARDLAEATSSASSKMIHGGLRYLEFMQFKMVREALQERERLMGIAPHIIFPMRFILPVAENRGRPEWMVRLGLFIYDHLAKRRRVPGSGATSLQSNFFGLPLKEQYESGFYYHDCVVDDSRLVILNALDAAERGAEVRTRTQCISLRDNRGKWIAVLRDDEGEEQKVTASMVVNAAGPWVQDVLVASGLENGAPKMRHVKGSHIIIPRAYEGEHSYLLQQSDGRVVFVWPYEDNYTLIGTTEEDYEGDVRNAKISDDEIAYLCNAFSEYFKNSLEPKDVLWSFSGVRPLLDEAGKNSSAVSRDFLLHKQPGASALMFSIYGGKLTTYRVVAEKVVNALLHLDSRYSPPWTASEPLPGGEFPEGHFAVFVAQMRRSYHWLPEKLLYRYARLYGTRMDRLLEGACSLKDLGQNFGGDVYEAEILYSIKYEWAETLEDFMFRRTKMGLHVSEQVWGALEEAWPEMVKRRKGTLP